MHTIYLAFFYKRMAFKFENEVRAIIDASPYIKEDFFTVKEGFSLSRKDFDLPTLLERLEDTQIDVDETGRNLKVDIEALIGEVVISPYTDKWIAETVESIVHQYRFRFPVNRSTLLDPPD